MEAVYLKKQKKQKTLLLNANPVKQLKLLYNT